MLTDVQKVGRFYHREQSVFYVRRFYWLSKSANFCMTDNRFLLADFLCR